MIEERVPQGRRQRAKEDKRRRIAAAARELFAERGIGGVTTQQIADRADVAIGTLFLYAATKAELLIMVQNQKFGDAITKGISQALDAATARADTLERVMALVRSVVECIREQPENGRAYLHELVFGDPAEPHRREGLSLAFALEAAIAETLAIDPRLPRSDATLLARVVSAIIHVATTATISLADDLATTLAGIRDQVAVILPRG